MEKLKICMLIFPDLTAQDFIGPYEIFIRAPDNIEVFIVSETIDLIRAEGGLQLKADFLLANCPAADILFVPGGRGVNAVMMNRSYLDFLQIQSRSAKYVTSVCTGSLILAVAGLLDGFKATTHWRSLELLKMFEGIEVTDERVVVDRNRITGGGVTAGIDFGLTLLSRLCGEDFAKAIQLALEYNPEPPFHSGSPKTAAKHIREKVIATSLPIFEQRQTIIQTILKGRPDFRTNG